MPAPPCSHAVTRATALFSEFEREGWPAYRTRFGLHSGEAVVGNVGSSDRMGYTVLGATVNLAARLEALNKDYGTEILVSEASGNGWRTGSLSVRRHRQAEGLRG